MEQQDDQPARSQYTHVKSPEIWPSQEDTLESFRNANVLPRRKGGGVTFPTGTLGRGFCVDQPTFERYREDLAAGTAGISRLRSNLETAAYVAIVLLAAVGMVMGRNSLAVPPLYWADVTGLAAVIALALYALVSRSYRTQQFLLRYGATTTVPPGSYLRRRLLGLMASGVHNYWRSLYNGALLLFFGIGISAVLFRDFGSNPWSLRIFAALLVIWGVSRLSYALAHIVFKLRHGRAPTTDDLEPV
ncbi:MAG TPA: hypothetical protein EYH07_05835 [Kiloniellaceae bacterium]|nr:hypothetical protein [Kiloniellaceae bacterium]